MESNPFEPSQQEIADVTPRRAQRLSFFWTLAALTVIGAIASSLGFGMLVSMDGIARYFHLNSNSVGVTFLVLPAVLWTGTFLVRAALVTKTVDPWRKKLGVAVLLAIPAYILYVPACTASSLATTPFVGSKQYGPTELGIFIGSMVSVIGILWIFTIVELLYARRRRLKLEDSIAAESNLESVNDTQ